MFELSLRDAAGNPLPVTTTAGDPGLFDEADLVPDTISQLNSMYFDEIYHGRTGYEQLHKMPVYETTHPPLGKDLIMAGIALFGMTGFGWRFSGTLFGVLLVPLAWCFARRLTRRRWMGAVAGVLLALDFMRFVQSRIATIDIYGTFFILLGAYCMLWYCQSVLQKGVNRSLLPMALGGVAFGLGCAAKWTGIYAGAGLAVLYLGVLYARWRQGTAGILVGVPHGGLGGVLFYVLLPLCLYIASYLPLLVAEPDFSLADWWNCQVSMYEYHSNLEATHPFESRWYTWLLGLRPVWYYQNTHLPAGLKASIAGLGGPVIWLAGLGLPGGAAVAPDQPPRQPGRRRGADPLRRPAGALDAGHPLHLPVPLFPQLHVLPGCHRAGALRHPQRSSWPGASASGCARSRWCCLSGTIRRCPACRFPTWAAHALEFCPASAFIEVFPEQNTPRQALGSARGVFLPGRRLRPSGR